MFKSIYIYEIKHWLKKPIIYVFWGVFFGMALVAFVGNSGVLDGVSQTANNARVFNSAYEVNYFIQYFNKFFLFLLPAIIGSTIFRDFKNEAHQIIFSFPLKKLQYLGAKFCSSVSVVIFITFSVGIALIVAENLPIYPDKTIVTFTLTKYVLAYLIYVIPNVLFYGIIVFSIVGYFRNIYSGFVCIIILLFIQSITQNILDGNGFLIALSDPLANNTFKFSTHEWNLSDKNTKSIPIIGVALYNRFLWLFIIVLIGGYTLKKFEFRSHLINNFLVLKRRKKSSEVLKDKIRKENLNVQYTFSSFLDLKNIWHLSNFNFRFIYQSWLFYIILAFGLFAVIFAIGRVTNGGEIAILPVTNIVLSIPAFFFLTISMLITFIYSGMLVNRERMSNCNQLVHTTAVKTSTLLLSKIVALIKMQFVLLLIMGIAGICVQLYNGYTELELDLYAENLFGIQLISLIIWAFTSVCIHVIVRNVYVGIFILLLMWVGVSGLSKLGIITKLLLFNHSEPIVYSDISGYNGQLPQYFLVKIYWLFLGFMMLVLSYLFYNRGYYFNLKDRFLNFRYRLKGFVTIIVSLVISGFVGSGFKIYYEEQKHANIIDEDKRFDTFKREFETYNSITNQPTIKSIDLNIALYPKKKSMHINGEYTLINDTKNNIDTLLIKNGFNETTIFKLNKPSSIVAKDEYVKFYAVKLASPLLPDDTLKLDFDIKGYPISMFKSTSKVKVSGTFISNNIFPRFGYFLDDFMPNPDERDAQKFSYHKQGADLVYLKTTISTSENQIATAAGKLVKSWEKDNRNYYCYETQTPIRNMTSFNSGDYKITSQNVGDISLEILHDKKHYFNIKSMIEGFKASVDFNSKYFGDYAFDEIRIIEFPLTEGTYATAMANTVPISEMRFISNSNAFNNKIDMSFYVIAHEITHHWFGKQLSPAKAKGATMLTESITEYLTLKVYESYYEKNKALQFLKKQHQRYWDGSIRENNIEPPLYLTLPNQQYIAYGKGVIAFNALENEIGEEKLLQILSTFLKQYKYKQAPYPTTLDLLNFLKLQIPESKHQIIKDYFETVTYFDSQIEQVEVVSTHANSHDIKVSFNLKKYLKDTQTALPLNNNIEMGFYDSENELIRTENIHVDKASMTVVFTFKQNPFRIVLDPNKILIEKNINDNVYEF